MIDISNPNVSAYKLEKFPGIKRSVFSTCQDHLGQVWIGTYLNGLYRFSTGDLKEQSHYLCADKEGLAGNIIRNIYQDKKQNLWIGTDQGLSLLTADQLHLENPRFINFKHDKEDANSISHNYILSILESSKGELWIGTLGGGLNKLIPANSLENSQFISFTEKEGLPNNIIKGILEDQKGNLWISTNKGLCKFDPANNSLKNYDVNDGLQSNEFQELACFKEEDGKMIFGGSNGFNVFYPDDIHDNQDLPRLVISNLAIKGRNNYHRSKV